MTITSSDPSKNLISLSEAGEPQGRDFLLTGVSPEIRCVESFRRCLSWFKPKTCLVVGFSDVLQGQRSEKGLGRWIDFAEQKLDTQARESWERNHATISKELAARKIETVEIILNSSAIDDYAASLRKSLTETDNIAFDISSLPKSHILETLRWMTPGEVEIIYTRAKHEQSAEQYSQGVRSIATLPGFEGEIRLRSWLMVLLLGFEGYRSLSLVNKYEPFRVLALVGDTAAKDRLEYLGRARLNNRLLLDHHMVREETLYSLAHPRSIADLLEARVTDFLQELDNPARSDYNFCASPLGTKLQAVGLYLYCRTHPETQVAYALPTQRRAGTGEALDSWLCRVRVGE